MTWDRVVVLGLVLCGIGAGTVLPILRARARKDSESGGLTFHQPRRDAGERAVGTIVGLLGAGHLAWGPLYAWLGPDALWVHPVPVPVFATGAGLYFVGLAIVIEAQRTMGRSWRIGIDDKHKTQLVTHGIFRFSRNPIFLGMRLNLLGLFLVLPNAVTLTLWLLGDVTIHAQIFLEEQHLNQQHGTIYQSYQAMTPRYFGWPRS